MRLNNIVKSFISWLLLSAIIVSSSGCSSKMKCMVYGKPGTTIYNSFNEKVGQIGSSGSGEVILDRNRRQDLLYARDNETSNIFPIGLDYDKRHNEFREAMLGIFLFPTAGLAGIGYLNYLYNDDVFDQLKLRKKQTTNQDLATIIYASSNPVDEIRALKPKEIKSGRTKESKANFSLPWINKEGEITELTTISIITDRGKKPQSFNGSLRFYYLEDNTNPMIRIKGALQNGSELNYPIALATQFKKDKEGYSAKEKDSNAVIKIVPLKDGSAALSFYMDKVNVEIAFNSDSFKETKTELEGADLFELLFGDF